MADAPIPPVTPLPPTDPILDAWGSQLNDAIADLATPEYHAAMLPDRLNSTELSATYTDREDLSFGLTGFSTPAQAGPDFTRPASNVIFTQAESGLPSTVWPSIVKAPPGSPGAYVLAHSTDHAELNGKLGFAYAATPKGPFISSGVTYQSALGTETETPCIVDRYAAEGKYYIYAQVRLPSGKQATILITTANFQTFQDVGVVIEGAGITAGDGHSGYAWGSLFGDMLVMTHLAGGGNYSAGAISYSRDFKTFMTDPRRLRYMVEIPGSNEERVLWNSLRPFMFRGSLWCTFATGIHTSGLIVGAVRRWWVAPLNDDFRSFRGAPREMFPSLMSGETVRDGVNCLIEHDGKLYGIYRSGGDKGDYRYIEAAL